MNRRGFISAGLISSVVMPLLPSFVKAKPIGRIVAHREYFFAHSQAQEDELYEAARLAAAQSEPLYFWNEEYRPPKYGQKGILIFPDHGMKGCDTSPYVNFCSVVLLPETIWHPAFEEIRRKAERW